MKALDLAYEAANIFATGIAIAAIFTICIVVGG
jgi:hypothetical protein